MLYIKDAIKGYSPLREQVSSGIMLDKDVSLQSQRIAHKTGWLGDSQQPLGTNNGSLADVACQFATCTLIPCLNEPRQIGPLSSRALVLVEIPSNAAVIIGHSLKPPGKGCVRRAGASKLIEVARVQSLLDGMHDTATPTEYFGRNYTS